MSDRWGAVVALRPVAGTFSTRQAAMNYAIKLRGPRVVRDLLTGETWRWRQGTWIKTAEPRRRKAG